jgi:hypothetical protein
MADYWKGSDAMIPSLDGELE